MRILRLQEKKKFFVPINDLIDYDEVYTRMDDIRNQNERNRRMYRYSDRYKGLGKNMIDSINIVL